MEVDQKNDDEWELKRRNEEDQKDGDAEGDLCH